MSWCGIGCGVGRSGAEWVDTRLLYCNCDIVASGHDKPATLNCRKASHATSSQVRPGSLHSLIDLLGLLTRASSLAFTAELALKVDQVLPLFLDYQCICISVSLYLCVAVVMANRRER